jgi:hypothetical protein
MSSDMSVELSGGELSESELTKLMETGLECEESGAGEGEESRSEPAPEASSDLINPVTGCIVNTDDIDSLILGCDECKRLLDDINTFYRTLREIAWSKTAGTTKTRRLKGRKYQAKIEQGQRYPVGSILKEAYNAFPAFRDKYLRIESVKLQMREYAKLEGTTSDDPAFVQFSGMLKDAMEKGSDGLPTVSLESSEK